MFTTMGLRRPKALIIHSYGNKEDDYEYTFYLYSADLDEWKEMIGKKRKQTPEAIITTESEMDLVRIANDCKGSAIGDQIAHLIKREWPVEKNNPLTKK